MTSGMMRLVSFIGAVAAVTSAMVMIPNHRINHETEDSMSTSPRIIENDKIDRLRESIKNQQKKQIITMSRLSTLVIGISAFKELRGECPRDLDELFNTKEFFVDPEGMTEYQFDGWGRKFYYFSSRDKYVVVSFGQNGIPDHRESEDRFLSDWNDEDADIVYVDGQFAQSPEGIDQF